MGNSKKEKLKSINMGGREEERGVMDHLYADSPNSNSEYLKLAILQTETFYITSANLN